MTVRVHARDLEAGKRSHCTECPIALAMRREGLTGVRVDYGFVSSAQTQQIETPSHVRAFMLAWDTGARWDMASLRDQGDDGVLVLSLSRKAVR